ncbi:MULTISPECIES: hypothetical protein [Acetobacter]|nr:MULTISPECIES: hypothetical protein [Acetobacter]ANA15240.1 hypothetical protein WG31_14065 [Acetobacter oryzifermentans]ARW49109.1 hypothetical protein S1001342_02819 [Acetobacter pasteurianus subsp. pasteurianus]ATI13564.1 hypothetical protein CPF11_13855 [Acetobacter pomorum]AXC27864.1 hypothetical protein DS739_13725 [Acetobacter sp. JWB]KAA8425417.1 hypothetical protein FKW54_09015 [Acetobacter pomorum]
MSLPNDKQTENAPTPAQAIEELKHALQHFTVRPETPNGRFFLAILAVLEAQNRTLDAMPRSLNEALVLLQAERRSIELTLQDGVDAAKALSQINERMVEQRILDVVSRVFQSLEPEIGRRAKLIGDRYQWRSTGLIIFWAMLLVVIGFVLGRLP